MKRLSLILIVFLLLSGCSRMEAKNEAKADNTHKEEIVTRDDEKEELVLTNVDKQFMKDFVGSWHASPSVGSGFTDRYIFFEDGTFEYLPSEYEDREGFTGTYLVHKNRLILTPAENGTDKTLKLPIEAFESEDPEVSPYRIKIRINGQYFWKYSDDPMLWME